ncbi:MULTISPECIES: helix-turn-helix domain-containing protein [Spirosoma]|uniref:AraC family transcriptional regulator n=1 Tax=Spirosoma sordidisoli TaxID=2502893 RepID=A0A4Q2UFL4_9BACT|nr:MULTISPECIES: helix-turn-helix domain-containing protein [Spirosoma]RYC68047.1 AraC family transcriptional regulator [Spirosoma sordidisoli]
MAAVHHLETISELNQLFSQDKPRHPLVSIIDFTRADINAQDGVLMTSGFYSVMFKNYCVGDVKYGRKQIDFQEATLFCIAPRQAITIEDDRNKQEERIGWGLFFHPDLIRGTSLAGKMKDYTFFSYEASEALHLSDKEQQTLRTCIQTIDQELGENIDRHSQTLIVSTIELLLNYCSRYYDRQFITRKSANSDLLIRFDQVLKAYFDDKQLRTKGLPTVGYLADQLALSAHYLSDLLKKETGQNAQDHIHAYLIEEAKTNLLGSRASVSEIAYQLGFEYPQYFSKLFKAKTGMTPATYRTSATA